MNNPVNASRVKYEVLRTTAFGAVTSGYLPIGTSFAHPIRIIKVNNLTDANVLISFNGVDNNDVVPSRGSYVFDYGSNASSQSGFAEQSAGERVFIKAESALPTLGSVYVTVIYIAGS